MANTHTDDKAGKDKVPKQVTIIINGREVTVDKEKLSFEELIALAWEQPPTGENVGFTVQYRRGQSDQEGSLVAGGSVEVRKGMVFNVSATDRS